MDDDWFRGPAWDDATRETFERKLGRARSSRSQYLRIKGLGLAESDNPAIREAGRALLRRVLTEHREAAVQVTMAHHDLAVALERDDRLEEAAVHYQAALDGHAGVDTGAALALAALIVRACWDDRYEEAAELLARSEGSHSAFPAIRFAWNLTAARLARLQGEEQDARELAGIALRCLADNRPPYPRHPDVGLIETDAETFRELERLAGDD